MADPTLAVIVLNWNGADDTLECLASMRRSVLPVHAIVVDNDSTGPDVERIEASGLADEILVNRSNLGYAGGNNIGLRRAIHEGFPLIAVMNNDTVVQPDTFSSLVDHLAGDKPRALSPDIRYFDDPERSWFAGGVLDNGFPRHLQPGEISDGDGPLRPSECLSGCCIVARNDTWEDAGLFDSRYFLIFEDSDWSLRARKRGVELYVARESILLHRVSRSFGSGPASLLGNFYYVRNGLLFLTAHARSGLPSFVSAWLMRPTASALLDRRSVRGFGFRWLGAFAFILGQRGRAPTVLERLAARLAR